MSEFIIFNSQEALENQAIAALADSGRLNQSFLYLSEGASSFYRYRNSDLAKIEAGHELAFFQQHALFDGENSLTVISLGCGNAGAEADLLKAAVAHGRCPRYIGVDTSAPMLRLAAEQFTKLCVSPQLILGDFTMPEFPDRLDPSIQDSDHRIFLLMGGTFGNVGQKFIRGLIAGLLHQGDYFYLDVVPMGHADGLDALRKRFSRLHENYADFFSQMLARLTISPGDGVISSLDTMETDPKALRTKFLFTAGRDLDLKFINGNIPVKKDSSIELLNIRAYDIDSLQNFIEAGGFSFNASFIPDTGSMKHGWQRLLFRRTHRT